MRDDGRYKQINYNDYMTLKLKNSPLHLFMQASDELRKQEVKLIEELKDKEIIPFFQKAV